MAVLAAGRRDGIRCNVTEAGGERAVANERQPAVLQPNRLRDEFESAGRPEAIAEPAAEAVPTSVSAREEQRPGFRNRFPQDEQQQQGFGNRDAFEQRQGMDHRDNFDHRPGELHAQGQNFNEVPVRG